MVRKVVIVGAGQAGLAAAAKLRTEGFEGAITLLGNEGVMPYQRPSLSKACLLGKPAARLGTPLCPDRTNSIDIRNFRD